MAAKFWSFLDDCENQEVSCLTFLDQTGTEADQECTVRDKTVQMFFEFGRLLE